ncbi:MAG: 3-hydroxyacyl-CoA dehydrogenase family protein [Chloroflexi bacterium]|nr:3-hydroxyacyl-CoA dehydrogenase family protein [Chloroflexota bacterium]
MPGKVGVVGSGVMGSEIAYVAARYWGGPVRIVDVSESALERCKSAIEKIAGRAVQKGQASAEEAAAWTGRVSYSTHMEDVAGSEFVVEAVFEKLALKQEVFAKLDEVCGPETILASNTSGLPISKIASVTKNPQRVIGTHFFNPASMMKLVEVVRGFKTSDETLEKTLNFCHTLGKETIVAKDFAGFIATRIGAALLAEAVRVYAEGVGTAEDIDKGCKLAYNHPMGPLELLDLIGLDTMLSIWTDFAAEFGETFRVPQIVKSMVAAGATGRKAGKGFYDYSKQ